MTHILTEKFTSEMDEIIKLIKAFAILNDDNPAVFMDKTALDIEKQKLKIIQDFEAILNKIQPKENVLPVKHNSSFFSLSPTAREILYYFILLFGLFECIAGSYLFGSTLFSLIPGSDTLHMIVSIAFTVLDSILFYAFEATFLKDCLSIPYADTDFTQSIKTCSNQLKTTISINKLLATIYMLNIDDALNDEYINLVIMLNADLHIKYEAMQPYPRSILTDIFKIVVLVYGALSNMAASYFFSNSILNMAAASLVATPVGWTIVGLTMLCGLGFYYAMGATSMMNLVTPGFDQYQTLNEELAVFAINYKNNLHQVISIRERYIKNKPIYSGQFFEKTSANEKAFASVSNVHYCSSKENNLFLRLSEC